MKSIVVLDGDCPAGVRLEGRDVWRWRGEGPGTALAEVVAERLLPLRAELNAWTVDTGRFLVDGRSVEEWFLGGENLSMWWCATLTEKHPKITHGLFDVFKLRALEQLMNEQQVSSVELISADWNLHTVLQRYCRVTNRKFVHTMPETLPPRPGLFSGAGVRRLYEKLPGFMQASVRFPVWLWRQRRLLPHTEARRPMGRHQGTMVTYFPNIDLNKAKDGRFRSRYWESLHDALTEKGQAPVNWLFLFFPSNQCDLKRATALRDAFAANGTDGLSFHFLEEFLSEEAIFRALKRYRRIRKAARRIESQVAWRFFFRNSRINFWPLLRETWKDSFKGWRCLERCLTFEALRGYAKWAGRQEFTVYVQENCPWERMLCQVMHDVGNGHVYGMQHSTVRPTDLRYFDDPRIFSDIALDPSLPDQFLNNGTGAQKALVDAGMPANRTTLVEALRYQYLATAPEAQPGGEVATTDSAEAAPARPRLLLCTSFFADETEAHLRSIAAAHRAGALEGYEVCIKPHPYLPVETRLAQLFPEGGAPEILSGPIGEQLTPGTIVWASNSTTVALEAAYRGLPVLVQAPEDDLNLSPVQDLDVPFVRTPEEVAAALKSATPPAIPPNYLCLEASLPRWRKLLKL